jgi:hypothetical protein
MLTIEQFHRLLAPDWSKEEFPVKLNNLLPLLQLQISTLLMNARTLLCEISRVGRVKATPSGNLVRKTIYALLNRCIVPDAYRGFVEKEKGTLNEQAISYIHKPRILLMMTNLLRKQRGYFYVTKKGREMIKEASAGELYALLFRIYFSKFCLSYMDFLPESYEFQASVAYSLYMLSESPDEWLEKDWIEDKIMLPSIRELIREQHPKHDLSFDILYVRLLLPLWEFGLIEMEYEVPENCREELKRLRKTELFDMFLSFDFSKPKMEKVAEDLSSYGFQQN